MRTTGWLMHKADAFFGSDGTRDVAKPDSFRFCSSCAAMQSDDKLSSWSSRASANVFSRGDLRSTCPGCAHGANCRGGRLQDAGISLVYCGWSDSGTSAEALRSWKSAPGNEANCLAAGRLLGEMLLCRCDDNLLSQSHLSHGNLLVPVPGWWGRCLRRGFDPPRRLAEGIAEVVGWPVWRPLFRAHGCRIAGKRREQRQKTSHSLFRLRSGTRRNLPRHCNLWLVDDLLASGSTSVAASTLLCRLRPQSVILVAANVRN